MGWNSWNSGVSLTEQTVMQTIDAMVSSGLRDAGYRYVNLDAGWAASTRDPNGKLQADPDAVSARDSRGRPLRPRSPHVPGHLPQSVQPGLRPGSAHRRGGA